MAMNMMGHVPNTDMFICFCETWHKRSEVWDPIIGKKLPLEFGAFNLAEQKDEATERAKGKQPASMKDKKAAKAKGPRPVARKRKAS